MKKNMISRISAILAVALLLPLLASCQGSDEKESDSASEALSESVTTATQSTEATTEADTDVLDATETDATDDSTARDTEDETEETEVKIPAPVLEGNSAELIRISNQLANGVNVYYPSGTRNNIVMENGNMSLNFLTATFGDKMVESIKNTKGNAYVENTMDVFVQMKDDSKLYYASSSPTPATMNIYRFGYYYYQIQIDGTGFTSDYTVKSEVSAPVKADSVFGMTSVTATESGASAYKVTNTSDPRIQYMKSFPALDSAKYNYIAVTMKITSKNISSIVSATGWIVAGSKTTFNESQKVGFKPVADGEFHTYYLRLDNMTDYTGMIKGMRFDLDGSLGDVFEIKEVKFVNLDTGKAPNLGVRRTFNTYSDKLVQTLQVTAKTDTTDIEKIGMVTTIDADTVAKLIVKDAKGTHTTLDNIDWESAEYIGFDIKDAGVFGYILLPDATSGKLEVTLEDGNYVIIQSRAPEGNSLSVPTSATLNKEDFYMGQRIYTDENHSFDAFLEAAYCERNPLPAENIIIDEENSDDGAYVGYNALRGTYEFTLKSSGFNTAYYKEQNTHYGIRFTVKGDGHDRVIYMESSHTGGQLECAAVLDENDLLIPVPVEVCKNFADGDYSIHWIKDETYSSTYLPIPVSKEGEITLNFLHLYQNWGRFPLKQISSIQFHCPYYHLSTGVTETNCIVPWYTTNGARDIYSFLPDHRAMSAPLWLREPQHTSGGSHGFLEYTDADGSYNITENTKNTILSYGPTYAELVMDYISDDGKIKVSYTHTEMPQTDENRTYYTMEYEVLEDLTISSFRDDFIFYTVSPKPSVTYQNVGYLSENNVPSTRPANTKDKARTYILGNEYPYFSMYQDDDCTYSDGYVNLAFLIHSSKFIMGGKEVSPDFMITDLNNTLTLSLDLGEVTLKAGDRFVINAIILPWGSQNSDYTLGDKNVRDVRENSIVNPLRAEADKDCKVIDKNVFLPTLRTTNGKSAEFTLSGGADNCTVRIEGFTSITVPTVYEKIDGEWVRYNLSSKYYPDSIKSANSYDGYGIQYDADGFLTYSFVVKMNENGDPRSFKLVADESQFVDEVEPPKVEETEIEEVGIIEGYNYYYDPKAIENKAAAARGFSKKTVSADGSYISFYGDGSSGDPQFYIHSLVNVADPKPTGQYFVFKYRMPSTNATGDYFAIFMSTENPSASGSSCISYTNLLKDDEWHVVVIDCAAVLPSTYLKAENGGYYAQHVRFDFFNRVTATTDYIDFAYVGFEDEFYPILEDNMDMENVTFFNGTYHTIPTDGGKLPVTYTDDTSENTTPLNVYLSAKKLAFMANTKGADIGGLELAEDESYVSIYSKANYAESYFRAYNADADAPIASGQYLVIKYRADGTERNYFELYASTVNTTQTAGDNFTLISTKGTYSIEDQWNIIVVDLAKIKPGTIIANDDGTYTVKYLRFDAFNTKYDSADYRVDLAYIGICDDLNTALTFDTSVETAIYYDGTETAVYSTKTGSILP